MCCSEKKAAVAMLLSNPKLNSFRAGFSGSCLNSLADFFTLKPLKTKEDRP
jgi:hypothetical protein